MKNVVIVLMSLFGSVALQAQVSAEREFIGTQGDYFMQSGLSMSWSFGEIISETFESADLYLGQGYQPSEIQITSLNEIDNKLKISVYPNPAYSRVNVALSTNEQVNYTLTDVQGKLVKNGTLNLSKNTVELADMPVGTYMLRVFDDKRFKSFKIVKL